MGHGVNKLMIQIALRDLSIAEMLIVACAIAEGDKGSLQQILRRLSLKDLMEFLYWRSGLADSEVFGAIKELMAEKSAYTLEGDSRLSAVVYQGRV